MTRQEKLEVDRTGQVRSVVRALTLMRLVAASESGLTLTEVAERAKLPASTTHRLLTTLEGEKFLRYDASTGYWQIGVNAFVVGSAFSRMRNILGIARPFLRRLMEMSGETASLFVESAGQVVCLDQVESRHTMRAITMVGGRMPMHASGAGKAILAHVGEDRLTQIFAAQGLQPLTRHTITGEEALRSHLAGIRTRGIAFDDQEHADGLRCVAAAVLGEHGTPVAAVSVSGPMARITDERMEDICAHVARIARDISMEFGGVPGDHGGG